jgi:hypothetical protein
MEEIGPNEVVFVDDRNGIHKVPNCRYSANHHTMPVLGEQIGLTAAACGYCYLEGVSFPPRSSTQTKLKSMRELLIGDDDTVIVG